MTDTTPTETPELVRIDGTPFPVIGELTLGELARLEAHFEMPATTIQSLPSLATFAVAWASANRGTPGGVSIAEIEAASTIEFDRPPQEETPTPAPGPAELEAHADPAPPAESSGPPSSGVSTI